MSLGSRIRYYREKAGWTLDQLSERCGVDVGTISALENRNSQRSKYAVRIASGFGLTLNQLEEEHADHEVPAPLSSSSDTKNTTAQEQSPDPITQRNATPNGTDVPHLEGSLHVLPIYRLEAFMLNEYDESNIIGTVAVPGNFSADAFAVRVEDETLALASPSISKGMVVVFDPSAPIKHQSIVLAGDPGTRPVIRQLICDGPDMYLSAPQSGIPLRKIEQFSIIAAATKAVIDLC